MSTPTITDVAAREATLVERHARAQADVAALEAALSQHSSDHHMSLVAGDVDQADELDGKIRGARAQLEIARDTAARVEVALHSVSKERQQTEYAAHLARTQAAAATAAAAAHTMAADIDRKLGELVGELRELQRLAEHAQAEHQQAAEWSFALDELTVGSEEAVQRRPFRSVPPVSWRALIESRPMWRTLLEIR